MESNIFTILGNRMKGGRACWSIKGGNNLARLLCLKFTGKMTDTMDALTSSVLPEKYAEEVRKEMSAANIRKRVGKGYEPKRGGAFPPDSGGKWLRDFGNHVISPKISKLRPIRRRKWSLRTAAKMLQ